MSFVIVEVKKAREAAGMSQEKLAAAIGVSSANYNKYETGKLRFTQGMLERIAAVPGMGLDLERLELLSLIDQKGVDKIRQAYETIIANAPPGTKEFFEEHPDEALELIRAEQKRRKEKK